MCKNIESPYQTGDKEPQGGSAKRRPLGAAPKAPPCCHPFGKDFLCFCTIFGARFFLIVTVPTCVRPITRGARPDLWPVPQRKRSFHPPQPVHKRVSRVMTSRHHGRSAMPMTPAGLTHSRIPGTGVRNHGSDIQLKIPLGGIFPSSWWETWPLSLATAT